MTQRLAVQPDCLVRLALPEEHEPKVGDFVPVDNAILKIAAREKAKLSSVSDDVDVELAGC